jgi:hypothetical protein
MWRFWNWPIAIWNLIRMPGKSHRGPLPPADDELLQLAFELRRHVTQLAEEVGERNVLHCPQELAQAADYIEAGFIDAGFDVKRQEYTGYPIPIEQMTATVRLHDDNNT